MKVRLSVQHQKANVKTVVLHSNAIIGRSTECNLRLASGQVSRQHCQLLIDDQRVAIVDLGSSNGTFLNGQQLTANVETLLPSGAELEIGPVKFTVEYDDPNADTSIRKLPPEQIVVTPSENTPPAGSPIVAETAEFQEAPPEPEVEETEFAEPPPEVKKAVKVVKVAKKVPAQAPPVETPPPEPVAEEPPAVEEAPPVSDEEEPADESDFGELTLSDVPQPQESIDADEAFGDTRAEFHLEDVADEEADPGEETIRMPPQSEATEEFRLEDDESAEEERPPADDDFMKFLNNLDD